jgi:hypothetical protein
MYVTSITTLCYEFKKRTPTELRVRSRISDVAILGGNSCATQAIRCAILSGYSRRILSICTCNSVAMFFLASSKLLPLTVTRGLLHCPVQLSSSDDQKSQSTGMLAVTCKLTTWDVIITPLKSFAKSNVFK